MCDNKTQIIKGCVWMNDASMFYSSTFSLKVPQGTAHAIVPPQNETWRRVIKTNQHILDT